MSEHQEAQNGDGTPPIGAVELADLPVAACLFDAGGCIVAANQRWYALLDIADGQSVSGWSSRFDDTSVAALRDAIVRAAASGDRPTVTLDSRNSGERGPAIEVRIAWIPDRMVAIAVFHDCASERGLAAESASLRRLLELARAQLEQVFLAATDALVLVDCETLQILDANPAAGRLYGYVPERLRSRVFTELTVDKAESESQPILARRDRLPVRFHRRQNGSHFPVEIFARYLVRDGREVAVLSISDVTNRNDRERVQLESELKYRAVFDAAPYPIVLLDDAGVVLDANPVACQLYGYERDELLGMRVDRLIGDRRGVDAMLRARSTFIPATTHIRRDGAPFLAETTLSFTRLDEGLILLAVVRDITEERRTLDRLQEAEERWRFALEGAGDGVWDWNLATQDFYHSPRWREMLGYAADDTRLSWHNLLHPEDKQQVYGNLDAYLNGESALYEAEFRLRCADGSYKWIAARGKIMSRDEQGRALRMLGTHRDITESRRMMETLRASEQRWQFALEGHGDGLWDWNLATGRITLSGQFREILGFGSRGLADDIAWEDLVHPDEWPGTHDAFKRHLAGHAPLLSVDTRMRCADGTFKWVALRGKVMEYGRLNRPMRMIGTLRDIEEAKRREVRERNEQEKLSHAGRLITLGEMASALAHELNQPLTAIRNFSALGLRRLGDHPPEGVRNTLEIIAEQSMRAGEIVRRIRSFVRKGEIRLEPVHINSVVGDMVRFSAPDARENGVQVVLELEEPLPAISGDRTGLEQLVMNLLRNGIEAMARIEGERRLTVCTAKRADGTVECSVTDLGEGLSADVLAGLFEPFVTTKPDGVGLGLAICRTIVENHGGRLWVEPTQGRGASFHFAIPIAWKGSHG